MTETTRHSHIFRLNAECRLILFNIEVNVKEYRRYQYALNRDTDTIQRVQIYKNI